MFKTVAARLRTALPLLASWQGVLALALLLRLAGLTYHSIWLDESVTLKWARLPFSEILAHTSDMREDAHPPLSYLTLHAWIVVFGEGEPALKMFSVTAGLANVALIYALARRFGGRRTALTAGLLAAINPYLIWYSQEVRMYALLGAFAAAAVYCFWRGLDEGKARWWAAFVLAAVAAIYTQLIGALILAVVVASALLHLRRAPRRAVQGLVASAFAGLSLVPLLMPAWQASGVLTTERVVPTLAELFTSSAVYLFLRQTPPHWRLLAAPGGLLVVIGIVAALRRDLVRGLFWPLYILLLLAQLYILSVWRLPVFGLPYIICLATPALISAALGIDALWQRRRAAGVAALLVLMLTSAVGLRFNFDHNFGKEDWRAAGRYLAAHVEPGDVILAIPDYAYLPLSYYFRSDTPALAPFGGPVAPEAIAPALRSVEDFDTVWLIWSHGEQIDPQGGVRRWLMERYPVLTEQYPRGVEMRRLAVRYRAAAPLSGDSLATFGGALRLLSAAADETVIAHDTIFHPPSGWVHLDLQWQRLDGGSVDGWRVQARVVDSLGQVWGERFERATEVWRFYPPARWQTGEAVRDAYDINMNPKTPPGRYRVEIQVLDATGRPVPVRTAAGAAERLVISDVEVR